MATIDAVIIGAGPYGLTIAAHLRSGRIPFRQFGTPMESWRDFMPEGMILKSERFASNLWDPERKFTLERYSAERRIPYQHRGDPLSLALFLQYAEWFRQNAVGDISDVRVQRVCCSANGFGIDTASGESLEARRVIIATGHMPFRYVPAELAELPEPLCLHSTRFGDVRGFKGRDVVVIGAGQSALESAVLLHEAGAKVRLVAKTEVPQWNITPNFHRTVIDSITKPESGLGYGWKSMAVSELPQVFRWRYSPEARHRFVEKTWGPAGSWWLRRRFEGIVDALFGYQIDSANANGERVELNLSGPGGKKVVHADHVIAGTGFKVDLDRLDFIDGALRAKIAREFAAPVLDSHFETSVSGLFVVGVASAPTFGPVMRFMYGAKHVGPVIAKRVLGLPRAA